ncbi:pathogenesis associated protein pep2 [Rhodotorula toruloides]|uniref:Pathogenesis associated protein pep2 n=1 Tax=Rhodotorula toruloides TaxID=5286 RepID=A0A511KQD6_RHOTO|nr:pathogenesis associated protein pep2 [Rhodotorula toruloides]
MSNPFGAQVPSPSTTTLFNGPDSAKLDRLVIREICEGWPCHRDARNWRAYRSMFTDDAQVFTTWSAGKSIDDFISASIAGFNRGERIMHAAMGCSVELGTGTNSKRAVGILKTCIDQRFELDGEKGSKVEVDAQCLNRFCFFCEKNEAGEWKVAYYKVIYEKDRLIPVDPCKLPKLDDTLLSRFPYGYRYLGFCQSLLGHEVMLDLPIASGPEHERLYEAMRAWTEEGADRERMDGLLRVERK